MEKEGEEEHSLFAAIFFLFLEAGAGFVYQAGAIMHDELKTELKKHICRYVPLDVIIC
jgi:hypothetical protein